MSIARIRPEVVAHTVCTVGHEDVVEAINPVVVGNEIVEGFWPSAIDFCMECDRAIVSAAIEVRR